MAGQGTPATGLLARQKVTHRLHRYQVDVTATNYGVEVAAALGVDGGRVFKTLVAEVDGDLVVAVVPVTAELDLKALAAARGGKRASMAGRRGPQVELAPADLVRLTGAAVAPIAGRDGNA